MRAVFFSVVPEPHTHCQLPNFPNRPVRELRWSGSLCCAGQLCTSIPASPVGCGGVKEALHKRALWGVPRALREWDDGV